MCGDKYYTRFAAQCDPDWRQKPQCDALILPPKTALGLLQERAVQQHP
jgi:hypothetical protein